MKPWLHCGITTEIIKTFFLFRTTYRRAWLIQIVFFPALQQWFLYGSKVIITLCRAETICRKLHFTIMWSKLFLCLNNLSLGLACLNPTFSSFFKVVLIWLKVHYYILQNWNNMCKHTFHNKSHEDFFFSKELIIGPSWFKSYPFQLFRGGFYMGLKSLLHSVELKQSVKRYISQ